MGEPLSRVEAILQNILGADNILVPPGSQVEEILQAIYYNTEYEKNPKSRVAEILLAIKNKGVYDGPVLSRMEDILVHKLNNIPYTKHKKEDLSRVEQLLLDWLEQGGGEEIIEYTGTFPMTILANGEPLLDYIISGNTTQSGTPTPDNPVIPQGTGERTGNLYSGTDISGSINNAYYKNDFVYANLNQGIYTLAFDLKTSVTDTYRSSIGVGTTGYSKDIQAQSNKTDGHFVFTFTIEAEDAGKNLYARFARFSTQVTITYTASNIMLNTGSTALPYEPYGYKIPISSANTTTPVYLGEVESTRQIKKLVLTGNERLINEGLSAGFYRYRVYLTQLCDAGVDDILSSHYPTAKVTNPNSEAIAKPLTVSQFVRFYSSISSIDGFKSYLAAQYAAGTPVTVWYVLATEETAVVNEPLMRIGDYFDTLSYAQAGVDVPTNKKPTETVIDVSTSVKPSEGYIKYTEPTDGPAPKTQVLGTKNHEIYITSNDEVYVLRR